MAADPIQRLVQQLARLPGIGEKSATRLAMHLVRAPKPQVHELAQALVDATEQIGLCTVCMTLHEDVRRAARRKGGRTRSRSAAETWCWTISSVESS